VKWAHFLVDFRFHLFSTSWIRNARRDVTSSREFSVFDALFPFPFALTFIILMKMEMMSQRETSEDLK